MVHIDNTARYASYTSEERKFGLVVGVNNSARSSYLSPLLKAEQEAGEIADVLKSPGCNFTLITPPLLGKEANTMAIKESIAALISKGRAQDFLLFYFSGHAKRMYTEEYQEDVYFVTHDFDEEKVRALPDLYLSMSWLWKALYQRSKARIVLVILDCCYAGNMVNAVNSQYNIDIRDMIEKYLNGLNKEEHSDRLHLILMATQDNAVAQERHDQSLMTGPLLRVLQGKEKSVMDDEGKIDILSLFAFLERVMGEQPPRLWTQGNIKPCILAYYPEQSAHFQQRAQNFTEEHPLHPVWSHFNHLITNPNFFKQAIQSTTPLRPFDLLSEENASMDDLYHERITSFFARDRTQLQDDFTRVASELDHLIHFGLLSNAHPTYGALLCFGLQPTKWIAGAFTRCTLWSGYDRHHGWGDAQDYRRDLIAQFEASRDFLRKHVPLKRIIGRDRRSEEWEIPLVALEEALANALIHREYAHQTSPVYVDIFTDRIEISSPGVLPIPMRIELLEKEHKSHPRNPQIARIFYLLGYVETVGSGIQRMQEKMKSTGLPPVIFSSGEDHTFTATFRRPVSSSPRDNISQQVYSIDSTTRIWNVPFLRTSFFTGRDDILTRLYDALHSTDISSSVALTGLGGIGKTLTALEYAYRHVNEYQEAVLWIRADTPDIFISDLVALVETLHLPEKDEQDQKSVVQVFKRWLRQHRAWLLIFDNVEALETVAEFLPLAGRGHILLTTRMQSTGNITRTIEVEKMTPEEGALFLLRRSHIVGELDQINQASEADRVAAYDITRDMGGLPLAIDQAGAFIEETKCGIIRYLESYHTKHADLLKIRGASLVIHPESVMTTFSLSFEKIHLANPIASEILRFCAFLAPDAIPEEFITKGIPRIKLHLQKIHVHPLELDRAMGELLKYSLIHRDPKTHLLTIHRLVQNVIKEGMDATTQCQQAEFVVLVVNTIFPDVDFTTWPQCQRCLLHAQMCALLIKQFDISFPEAARLFDQTGLYLQEHAHYTQAEPLFLSALDIRQRNVGPLHPDIASSLNRLATLYRMQGKYTEAESLFKQAYDMNEKTLGVKHAEFAASLNNLALLYYDQGKYEQAEPLYEQALSLQEQLLGSNHPIVAQSLNNLARLYRAQGKYSQAEPLYQRALAMQEQMLGPDHPDVAQSLANLAEAYRGQGKYTQAMPFYQRALAIREQTLGPDHPDVAQSLNNMARLYRAQGKYAQAEPLYLRTLSIREQIFGSKHPDVARILNSLAKLYLNLENYAQAEIFGERALAIQEALGTNHPDVPYTLNNLAKLYTAQGKYDRAELLYQRALKIREAILGIEHPLVALVINNFAEMYLAQKNYTQALSLFIRALNIYENTLGPNHPYTAFSLNGLGKTYYSQGFIERAELLYIRALRIREQTLGSNHPYTAATLDSIANIHISKEEYIQAGFLYQRVLAIREAILGKNHLEVAKTVEKYSVLLRKMNRGTEAAELEERAKVIRANQSHDKK